MPGRPLALARQVTKTAGIPNGMRTGTVVSVDATGVTVDIAGGEVLCGLQGNSVGVAPGAVVNVFRQDSSWVVQGVVNGGGNRVTNSTVLPGAQLINSGATYASGITTGSGEVVSNLVIPNTGALFPLGHLIQVRFLANFIISVANGSVGARIRFGTGTGGVQIGSGHGFGPSAGFAYELSAEGWIEGDGLAHSVCMTVQNLTGGNLSIFSTAIAPGIAGVFDWGDATGVTAV